MKHLDKTHIVGLAHLLGAGFKIHSEASDGKRRAEAAEIIFDATACLGQAYLQERREILTKGSRLNIMIVEDLGQKYVDTLTSMEEGDDFGVWLTELVKMMEMPVIEALFEGVIDAITLVIKESPRDEYDSYVMNVLKNKITVMGI